MPIASMNAVAVAVAAARSPSDRARAKTTVACSQTHGFRDHLGCVTLTRHSLRHDAIRHNVLRHNVLRHNVLRHKRARTNDGCGARGGGDPMNVTHDEPGVVQLQLQPFVDEPRLELLLQPGTVGTLPTHHRGVGAVIRLVPGYDAFGTAVRHVPDLDHAVVVVVRVGDEVQMHVVLRKRERRVDGVLGVVCLCESFVRVLYPWFLCTSLVVVLLCTSQFLTHVANLILQSEPNDR